MAIHQTKQQSDIEKRLRLLRQQVYGKEMKWEVGNERVENEMGSGKSHLPPQYPTSHIPLPTSDINYLHHDLLKISILASLALGAQIILFIFTKNRILNLNFF